MRMRRQGELAVVRDAQGFSFDAAQAGRQRVPLRAGSQQSQAVRKQVDRARRCCLWH